MAEVTVPVLAHQGGWDELLMVLVPIIIFAVLLVIANRRASSLEQREGGGGSANGTDGLAGNPPEASAGGDR